MEVTGDWAGGEPESGSMTRHVATGGTYMRRQVRPDGSVMLLGRRFVPPPDVQLKPIPGEWLLFYAYGPNHPHPAEWTAPADPDGYIRRQFWQPA